MVNFQMDETTVRLLKNFAGISKSVLLTKDTRQKAVAATNSVMAIATLPKEWPKETAIFDLTMFLGALSLFDKTPTVSFGETSMEISDGRSRLFYRYSDPTTVRTPPNKELTSADPAVTLALPSDVLTRIVKTCLQMELDTVTIDVSPETVVVRTQDIKNPNSHAFEYEFPAADVTRHDTTFMKTLYLKREHVQMLMDGAYTVSLSSWVYAHFAHKSEPIEYFVVGQRIVQ